MVAPRMKELKQLAARSCRNGWTCMFLCTVTNFKDISPNILKNNSNKCSKSLQQILNNCIGSSSFSDELKFSDVFSFHKQKSAL